MAEREQAKCFPMEVAEELAKTMPLTGCSAVASTIDPATFHWKHLDKERLTRQALRRLEALGYTVTLTPKQEEVG